MTESPPTEAAESSAPASPAARDLYAWLSTSDHKVIGRIWLRTAALVLLAAALLGVLVAAERLDTDGVQVFGGDNSYFQMWTLHRFGLLLLVAAPLFIGLATSIVPMQVGSPNIAFPRAALAAAWGYVIGAGILVVSVLAGGGWGAIDGAQQSEQDAIALTLLGTGMVIVSILLASICVATTIISLRTSGMNLMRVPLFAWSMLVTATVWILTLPIAIANIAVLYVDLRGGPKLFGDPQQSTTEEIYFQLSWLTEQPALYSFAVPVLGVLGSVIPVVAKGRQISHPAMMVLLGAAGLLAVGGWSQPAFADNRDEFIFIAFGLAAVVPVLAFIGGNAATLAKGEAPVGIPPAHMAGAFGGALLLLTAVSAGALRVVDGIGLFELELMGSTADTAMVTLVAGAAIVSALAGWWFWAPKIEGRMLSPMQGLGVATMFIGGGLLAGLAGVLGGFDDATDIAGLEGELSGLGNGGGGFADVMAVLTLVGSVLFVLGALGLFGAMAMAMRSDDQPEADPWGGHTLEWATQSPPSVDNFDEAVAKVTSESPLLDLAAAAPAGDDGGES